MFKACVGYKLRNFDTFQQALDFICENMYLSVIAKSQAIKDYKNGLNSLDFTYGFTTGFIEEID
jgi:hypothetical protein